MINKSSNSNLIQGSPRLPADLPSLLASSASSLRSAAQWRKSPQSALEAEAHLRVLGSLGAKMVKEGGREADYKRITGKNILA